MQLHIFMPLASYIFAYENVKIDLVLLDLE